MFKGGFTRLGSGYETGQKLFSGTIIYTYGHGCEQNPTIKKKNKDYPIARQINYNRVKILPCISP
jgi:hypothetical protein